ncbi:N-acetylneuraminate synthase [Chitinispirillum alkaliphilum]|nr:N-acetylneuraminate synthase [Chitinispirillum alkaliphilum]
MGVISLGSKLVGAGHPVFVIAEVGINHQGDIDIAKKLIKEAKNCGADAVKFQKRSISRILTREGLEMPYENSNSFGKTYGEHKRALELDETDYVELKRFCAQNEILFCASGWDEESIDFLDSIDVPFFKMASADLTNLPLLEHTAKKDKPVILSTGMACLEDVRNAYVTVGKHNDKIAILQCTSTYPSKFSEINLNVLHTFKKEFPDAVIGFSGHELGIAIPPVAVGLGACIIEKHFTLDRTMKGGDHAASLEPQGFAKMVRDIHHVTEAMGSFEKGIQDSEYPIFKKLTKSIVSACELCKDDVITADMLTTKGPGTGISPTRMEAVIGKRVAKLIPADSVIKEEDILW